MLPFALTSCCTDYIQHIGSTIASLSPCSLPQRLYRQAQSLLRSLLPWSNIASKTGIQYSRTMWCDSWGGESCHNANIYYLFWSFSVIYCSVCILPTGGMSSLMHADMKSYSRCFTQLCLGKSSCWLSLQAFEQCSRFTSGLTQDSGLLLQFWTSHVAILDRDKTGGICQII